MPSQIAEDEGHGALGDAATSHEPAALGPDLVSLCTVRLPARARSPSPAAACVCVWFHVCVCAVKTRGKRLALGLLLAGS